MRTRTIISALALAAASTSVLAQGDFLHRPIVGFDPQATYYASEPFYPEPQFWGRDANPSGQPKHESGIAIEQYDAQQAAQLNAEGFPQYAE